MALFCIWGSKTIRALDNVQSSSDPPWTRFGSMKWLPSVLHVLVALSWLYVGVGVGWTSDRVA